MSIDVELLAVHGWMPAIIGMRNPLNSWGRIDSSVESWGLTAPCAGESTIPTETVHLGPNDRGLMERLLAPGTSDHCKFRRYITVYLNVTAPLYFWKEWDTYKVGTVANSTSTMHTVMKRPFAPGDFATDRLSVDGMRLLMGTIAHLNRLRERHEFEETDPERRKAIWDELIQLLPSSLLQTRTVKLNYEVLANMVEARRNHKLGEWREFCRWCRTTLQHPWIFDRREREALRMEGEDDG